MNLRDSQTSMNKDVVLEPASADHTAIDNDKLKYQCAVESLMYLMLETRPDIAFAVSQVSRFSSNSTTEHWKAVQRIFRYLKKFSNLGLVYRNEGLHWLYGCKLGPWQRSETN
jgi:hypothetical protein